MCFERAWTRLFSMLVLICRDYHVGGAFFKALKSVFSNAQLLSDAVFVEKRFIFLSANQSKHVYV